MATFRRVTVVDPNSTDVAIENGSISGALTALIVLAIVGIFALIGYFVWYVPGHPAQAPSSHTVIERNSTTNRTTNTVPAPNPVIIHDSPVIIHDTPAPTPTTPPDNGETSGSNGGTAPPTG